MPAAIALRDDYDAETLRRLARRCRDAKQSHRMLAIASVYDGLSRAAAAKAGGMDRQVLRDWVLRFNEEGPEGLVDRKPPGARCRLSDEQLADLGIIVEAGPQDGLVRWRCRDLQKVIQERFGVTYKERAVANLLKQLGFSRISGRPQHPKQDGRVIEAFKKTSPPPCKPT